MELFIPSLVVIILGAIVVFFILPKAAPYTLGVMAVLLFGAGILQHYQTFPYEYSTGNFRDTLKDYAPFLMLLATILGLVVGVMVAFGGNPPALAASLPAMPSIAAMPASLPSLNVGGNMFGATAKNNSKNNATASNVGGNVKRNNVASTSFKVT
jgi:hypothetical protein